LPITTGKFATLSAKLQHAVGGRGTRNLHWSFVGSVRVLALARHVGYRMKVIGKPEAIPDASNQYQGRRAGTQLLPNTWMLTL
jgi:hypothetical protein